MAAVELLHTSLLGPTEFGGTVHTPTAYYRFESGAETTDSSGNSHTLTAIATPTFSAGKFGQGVDYASASSQAHSIVDHSNLKPTGNFTIGGWLKTSTTGTQQIVFSSYSANTNIAGIYLRIETTNVLRLLSGKNNGTTAGTNFQVAAGTTNVCDNVWHFFTATYDGSFLRVFIDGVQEVAVSWTSGAAYAATNYVRVGCKNDTGTDNTFFNGSLDEVFLINGTALTTAQVATIYGAQAYYQFNTGALTTDSKGFNTLTNNNTVGETASGKFGYAADFGSSNSNKSFIIANKIGITTWASPFTFSLWIKRYGEITSGEQNFIFHSVKVATSGGVSWIGYQYNGGTPRLNFSRYDGTNTENAYITTSLGTDWHHVVMVYDGTNITPYLNGVAGTPVASDGTGGNVYSDNFGLGWYGSPPYFSGYIDDVAVFNRALTAQEVEDLFDGDSATTTSTSTTSTSTSTSSTSTSTTSTTITVTSTTISTSTTTSTSSSTSTTTTTLLLDFIPKMEGISFRLVQ